MNAVMTAVIPRDGSVQFYHSEHGFAASAGVDYPWDLVVEARWSTVLETWTNVIAIQPGGLTVHVNRIDHNDTLADMMFRLRRNVC